MSQTVLGLLLLLSTNSMSIGQQVEAGLMKSPTPNAAISLRPAVNNAIWESSTPVLPTFTGTSGGTCCGANPAEYFGGRATTSTTWLTYNWGYGGSPSGMYERIYYARFNNTSCLLLQVAGHQQGYFLPRPNEWAAFTDEQWSPAGVKNFVRRMIDAGCDVLLTSMPLLGENRTYLPQVGYPTLYDTTIGGGLHDWLFSQPRHAPPSGSPLQYFISAKIKAIDYALSQRSYDKIVVAGLSGGGWTATVLGALDNRIHHTYSVAGSVPLPSRVPLEGDTEQRENGVWGVVASYADLYLMAAAEANRTNMLLYHGADTCCFKGINVNSWAIPLLYYARANGWENRLRILSDPDESRHTLTTADADAILEHFQAQ